MAFVALTLKDVKEVLQTTIIAIENSVKTKGKMADSESVDSFASKDDDTKSVGGQSSGQESETSEFNDSQAKSFLSVVQSMLMSATPLRKPSYIFGIDSWVPSNPNEIAEIPEGIAHKYMKVHPIFDAPNKFTLKNGDFSVLTNNETFTYQEKPPEEPNVNHNNNNNDDEDEEKGIRDAEGKKKKAANETEGLKESVSTGSELSHATAEEDKNKNEPKEQVHHLVITLWTSGDREKKFMLSLYRSRKMAEVVALCERCRENPQLFQVFPQGMDQKEYINLLLGVLREHILWKSFHIAAKIGLTEYFKNGKRHKIEQCFQVICQPEGMPPLMIAIGNDQIETVKEMIEFGADVSAVCADGSTVLHVAATSSPEMIRLLWATGKCEKLLNAPDGSGYSPLYLAVTNGYLSCARCISSLGGTLAATDSKEVQTPLIDAMKKGKLDEAVLSKILEMSPDALKEKDMHNGNGVLHCAINKKTLLILLEKGIQVDISSRNLLQQTPLHVFVQRGELPLVLGLCAHEVDLNAVDCNGNTPLHIAVTHGRLDILRFLLCVGADPNTANRHKETPRHIAARISDQTLALDMVRSLIVCGGHACQKNFVGCTFMCMHREVFAACQSHTKLKQLGNSKTTEDEKVKNIQLDKDAATEAYEFELDPDTRLVDEAYVEKNETRSYPHEMAMERVLARLRELAEKKEKSNLINVLALDGGGIRGLVMVQILLTLQKYLDEPLVSYFDWIAATSTGCYVTAVMLSGKALREGQKMYLRFKEVIFDSWTRPYSTAVLEGFLQTSFGTMPMSHYKYPKTFFTTVRADTFPVQLEFSRNYRLPISIEENNELGFVDPAETPMWRAMRRSSAAPTYFSASEGKFIDGGMVANNPTLDLLSEIHFWNVTCKKNKKDNLTVDVGCVLSVGTGVTPICPVDPTVFEMGDFMGIMRGIKNLTMVVIDQVTATEGAPITRSRSWCHSLGIPYFRLNPPLFKDIVLDSNNDADLAKVMWDAVVYSHTHRKDFEELAGLLKKIGTSAERKTFL